MKNVHTGAGRFLSLRFCRGSWPAAGGFSCTCGGVRIPPFRSACGSDRRPEGGRCEPGRTIPTLSGWGSPLLVSRTDLIGECSLSGDDFLDGCEGCSLSHQETEVPVGVARLGSPCVFDHAGLLRGEHQCEGERTWARASVAFAASAAMSLPG